MKLLDIRSVLTALVVAAVFGIPQFVRVYEDPSFFAYEFEVLIESDVGGITQAFFDNGNGFQEQMSSRVPLIVSDELRPHRFPIPSGVYSRIRFDPINGSGKLSISHPRIIDSDGKTIREIPLEDFVPNSQVTTISQSDGILQIGIDPRNEDPQLIASFDYPIELKLSWFTPWLGFLKSSLGAFLVILGGLWVIERLAKSRDRVDRIKTWCAKRPRTVIALAAAIGAIISTYPVIFLGKSFVSPNYTDGTFLLYQTFPTLPGYTDARTESANSSDVGAIAWHHHPLSIIEHRALFRDGELPLWNRYNSTGSVLLGQGQSMFGDPLHILPILANGAAWAWDLKYVLAKWMFACALGLVVFRCTRHLPSALVTAATATFIGFFLYRVNHPAIFSLCYSPWILYSWLLLLDARGGRESARAVLALTASSWMVLTSGTAKEAYMLLIGLNLTGVIVVAFSEFDWHRKILKIAIASGAGLLLLLAASPVWVTFYEALASGYSVYDAPYAYQIDPSFLVGVFDEIFYRCLPAGERVFNPSANFLVLLGVLMVLATFRQTSFDRLKIAFSLAALIPLSFAFGLVPPELIARIPILANIVHIDNTFSCVLIVLLFVVAGFGYRIAFERLGGANGRADIATASILLGTLLFPWIAVLHTVHRQPYGAGSVKALLQWGRHLHVSNFLWASLVMLPLALIGLLLIVRSAKRRGYWTGSSVVLVLLCTLILLWRHGQHLPTGFSTYVYIPPVRVDFDAESPAISYIQSHSQDPYRVVGFDGNLTPGWSAAYDLEMIAGPEAVVNGYFRDIILATKLRANWGWRLYTTVDSIPSKRIVYDFFNVRYFLKPAGGVPLLPGGLTRAAEADLDVFESDTAWPRAFFTDRLASYEKLPKFADLILSGDGKPFAAGQKSDASMLPNLPRKLSGRTVIPARNYKLTVNTTSFEITAPGPGVVVLQEAWLANAFKVKLNGKPVDYFRVNHAFKGIELPEAGTYRVSFSYWPPYFTICLILSGGAFAAIAWIIWVGWRQPKPEDRSSV